MIAQQDYFTFKNDQKKIFVEFDNSGGLIIVPIELNGTKLNFMLDTGAPKILFIILMVLIHLK
ncbi:hypothetical protein JCM19294_1315 [Nonlabens tegetincola]|uniref:Peptidase A2 domain-containing protein n=1 Tax=Nonlabens tegetincola TaxID=323273 RepID=A0A090Q2G2_9FLAO|nr:hypothetical protein [Nonlabens tegetincola]GAK97269.1 hypothetical protein JCM19294_1315 [Nonlabens tegetincola]